MTHPVLRLALTVGALSLAGSLPAETVSDGTSAVVGAPRHAPLVGAALTQETDAVAALLRCPVCQGLSIKDSPATMAVKMKAEVKEMLAQGYDPDQILSYFETSYGEFVRLKPPVRGVNWVVWLAPAAGLLVGTVVLVGVLRRRAPAAAAAAEEVAPRRGTLPNDSALAACVRKVRERAYGWPGGIPPETGGGA